MNRILVAYASKHGSTAEIAEKIGSVLRQANLHVEVRSVGQIETLETYQAVILGSAVYAGQWRKEAVAFLQANERKLAELPTWFFSSGPTGEGDPVQLMKGWRFPKGQQAVADRIRPRDIVLFQGELNLENLSFTEKLMVKGVKAPIGDFRDWTAVTAWSNTIADGIRKADSQPQTNLS